MPQPSHVFLSPHLDDAVFSCGGTLWAARVHDQPVLVATFFAASPPGGQLSPFARELHRAWGDPPNPYRLRRGEDRRALVTLRIRGRHFAHLDAVYRSGPDGWLYPDQAALFGRLRAEDEPLIEAIAGEIRSLARELAPARVYAPLALGGHVDHQIVRRAAESAGPADRRYYEDFPYAARGAWQPPQGMEPELLDCLPYLEPKLDAMARYASQIPLLFGTLEAMREEVRRSMEEVGGERFWVKRGSSKPHQT